MIVGLNGGTVMQIEGKISFLGGGRMAEALIKGITESGLVKAETFWRLIRRL